jgi:hypothetical protein
MTKVEINTTQIRDMIDLSAKRAVNDIVDGQLTTLNDKMDKFIEQSNESRDDIKKTLDELVLLLKGDNRLNEKGIKRKVDHLWDREKEREAKHCDENVETMWRERNEERAQRKLFKYLPMILSIISLILGMIIALMDIIHNLGT